MYEGRETVEYSRKRRYEEERIRRVFKERDIKKEEKELMLFFVCKVMMSLIRSWWLRLFCRSRKTVRIPAKLFCCMVCHQTLIEFFVWDQQHLPGTRETLDMCPYHIYLGGSVSLNYLRRGSMDSFNNSDGCTRLILENVLEGLVELLNVADILKTIAQMWACGQLERLLKEDSILYRRRYHYIIINLLNQYYRGIWTP